MPAAVAAASLAADVRHYLTQTPRQLPSSALYDPLGSALFDAICHLPWYPVTRAERRLIAAERRSIFRAAGATGRIAELGCGNGDKLDLLLGRDGAAASISRIDLIDVSASALASASALVQKGRSLVIRTHQQRYEEGLETTTASRAAGDRFLVLFLGSNIGNFDPPGAHAFLQRVHAALAAGDRLLIGADLLKSERELQLAYDDPLGVTAAFNKNLLVRLNRELGANFDVTRFEHRAVWNRQHSRVEMHLVSRARHRVEIPAAQLSLTLERDESIWTESSYKYDVEAFEATLGAASFVPAQRWIDREGQFLLLLAGG